MTGDHAGHGRKVCQWGYLHSQCRCPDNKAIIHVACDSENEHDPKLAYKPKHAREAQ